MIFLKKAIDLLYKVIDKFCYIVIAVSFSAIVIILGMQMLLRVLGSPTMWSEEVCRYLFIWLLFLGGAQAFSKGGHLVVDVVFARFPRRMQLILMFVYYIVIAVFSGYLLYSGMLYAMSQWTRPMYTVSFIPLGWVDLCIPVGSAVTILYILRELFRMMQKKERYLEVSDVMAAQKCFSTMNSFTLMAVPFYILAGELMNTGGITRKLIRFCSLLLQHWRGALAHANVLVSMIMAGFAGSATADAVSVGAIMIPAMEEDNYTPEFSAGVTAASSCIGPIIPPSLTMVIYGGITGLSIGTLFMAGIVPGILIGLAQMGVCAFYGRKENWPKKKRAKLREILSAAWDAKWALVAPVIVLGGIMSGAFTATEAGIVLVIYSFFVSVFAYKEIKLKDIPALLNKACVSMAIPCMIICLASLFGQVITRGNFATILCGDLLDITTNPTLILLMVIGILFVVGLFLDGTVAMMIFVPVLFPIGNIVGLDPIFFAIIIMITILVGTITPPVGLQLFIAAGIAKVPVTKVVIWPFVLVMVALLIVFTFVPEFITLVPKLLSARLGA